MGSTYLELTNKVLIKLNEVELTSASFASTVGFHSVVKDAVQYAVDDINQAEFRWPFNYQQGSQVLTSGTQEYSLPSDMKVADWKTFLLVRDDSLAVHPRPIPFIEYSEYHNTLKGLDLADVTVDGVPSAVFQTRDDKFGVSPVPNKAYTVEYDYWRVPVALAAHDDICTIPTEYDKLIVSWGIGEGYDFRENYEMAGKEYSKYKKGLKQMRKILVPAEYHYAYDTRTVRRRRRNKYGWSK